ncbi:MAG: patatin-like phospholipase family protein [Acidimicrobiales bacterium]
MSERPTSARRAADRRSTPRIGLVLGAGGTVGAAYHAGVLFSIEHHTGFDPRDAAQIVGTSAGSLVGALLRAGVSAEDLVRLARRDPALPVPSHLRGLQQASVADAPTPLGMLFSMRPPTLGAVANTLRHRSPWPWLLSWSRHARFDLQPLLAELDTLCGGTWPERDLRICAASAADGGRRVLDGSSGVRLSQAVAASCAVPGMFRPQHVRDEHLVDGGVWSVTNVDALDVASREHPIDEVWIVAPMAGSTFRRPPTALVHRRIRQTLHRELESLPSGMPVRVFTPGRESSDVMGIDLMSEDRTAETILAGFLEAGGRRSA